MSIFKFKVVAVSKANQDLTFECGSYIELDQAKSARVKETKAYTYNGVSNWEFVIQRIY